MQSLYSLGVRQTTSLQADLDRMRDGDNSTALQGQIAASLAALNRTVEDYDSMAKREMIKAKQEKALMRVQKFRADYMELRAQFDRIKQQASNARLAEDRNALLGAPNGTASSSTARQRFGPGSAGATSPVSESPFRTPTPSFGPTPVLRQDHALREHTFLDSTESQLDSFIAQGREVLDNLVDQRNMLKGTHKRLLDAANTLGLSRDVIGWIEKRSKQDTIIFFVGAVFTFVCFYFIWKWFG
ncbi:V-snare-domain-containing protein [Exidia glandulosa HHB12029]|uniref:Protein transport protein BOS1 n=1 Tax=Exidia glandulosa HHB12029 TaxID=1314781 RepID=A0A165N6V8_EXIGL|nr:V-snare-domain-containing protein [Exidia glandulosa HHB12029]KZW00309.1 V-snare-domain-containing protein [Exidia glandulosa HHB12029]